MPQGEAKGTPMDKKVLFHVYSPGRKLEGEFGSKMAAKKFRNRNNADIKDNNRHWWVGVGRDHWRWSDVGPLPKRGRELHWKQGRGDMPILTTRPPEDHWLDEVALAA